MRRPLARSSAVRWPWLLVGPLLLAAPARAAEPNDVLLAESLYQSGKKLFDAGTYAEACPKLAESHRLDPAGGTALLLATCWERAGKIALATVAYQDAVQLARRDRRADREKLASERLRAIEPDVPHLRIVLSPEASRYGSLLQVTRDGTPLVNAALGVDLLVDPGKHVVRALGPDLEPYEVTVELAIRDHKEVIIPAPAERKNAVPAATTTASAAPLSPRPPPAETPSSWRPTAGVILAGTGVVLLGFGAYTGLRARSLGHEANDLCPTSACGSHEALDKNQTAHSLATVSTVTFSVGALAVGAGAYLWFTAPSARPAPATSWRPVVGPGFAGGAVQGIF